jgi:hypothetical protein
MRMPGVVVGQLIGLSFFLAATGLQGQEPKTPVPGKATNLGQPQARPYGPDQGFRVESEATWKERLRREARKGPNPRELVFPEDPVVSTAVFGVRNWEPMATFTEPAYVCYHPLYFEQINSERYGWDVGVFHPLLSAGIFYFDWVILPYKIAAEPWCRCECSAGLALPGDHVPLVWNGPGFSPAGAAAEAVAIGLIVAALVP